MKFKEIKKIMNDGIELISLVAKTGECITYRPVPKSPEENLLDAIFRMQLPALDEFEVIGISVGSEGFIVEFDYNEEIGSICEEECIICLD